MLPSSSAFHLWLIAQWFFVIFALSAACSFFHCLVIPWQPILLSLLIALMAVSSSLTHCLPILFLVFPHCSDIAMIYSSTQTQLYINCILILYFPSFPITSVNYQSDTTGLSPDVYDSAQTLEAQRPYLTGTKPWAKPCSWLWAFTLYFRSKPHAWHQEGILSLIVQLWYFLCPVLSSCYVFLYPTRGILVFI